MKKSLIFTFLLFISFSHLVAEEITGFWKTIDDKTGKPRSIVAIYENQGKYFGRLIATYDDNGRNIKETIDNPQERAPGVEGNPYYNGLDIIWNLHREGNKYVDGKILDPEKGRVYDSEMWLKNGKLVVRGKIWVFGANQEWLAANDSDFPSGFNKPDLTKIKPVIPVVKRNLKNK